MATHSKPKTLLGRLGDLIEQSKDVVAMLVTVITLAGAAVLFGLGIVRDAGLTVGIAAAIIGTAGLVALCVWRLRVASRKLAAILAEEAEETTRARVARALRLVDAPPEYAEVYDPHYGAKVCAACGFDVTEEPCPKHGPATTPEETDRV